MSAQQRRKQERTAAARPKPKRRNSEEIKNRLLLAAEQEFKRCGYSGATTAAIAKSADVTEAQIFRLYRSKQELFGAAIFQPLNRHFTEFMHRQIGSSEKSASHSEMATRYIEELQDFFEDYSGMLMSLIVATHYGDGKGPAIADIDGLRSYFERGALIMANRIDGRKSTDAKLLVRVSFAAVLANVLFEKWLFPKGTASRRSIRNAIADFVIEGIGAHD
jgi:AcrR family transcriptional regulator